MMKTILSTCICAVLLTACSQTEEENMRIPEAGEVSFSGSVAASSRATGTAFDSGDQISVFAFKDANGFQLENIYATNRKYAYGNQFTAIDANNAIVYPEDKGALSFQAIYPYLESAGASFTFNVKEDQSVAGNYTQSDLMTASAVATTDLIPHLKFGHRLTNVIVNLTFDQTPAGTIKVEFQQVTTTAAVDMVAATFKSTGDQINTVRAASDATNSYRAILPPQTIEADAVLAIITTETGEAYPCKMPKKEIWKSGVQYVYNLHISKEGEVTFTAEIDPWGEPEDIEAIIPPALLDSIEKYMPIYRGDTPPNVEGTYLLEPNTAVYCQDGGYKPGTEVLSTIVKLYNQNMEKRTLELDSKNVDNSSFSKGSGSFISGTEDHFTVYFDSEGESRGIYTRTADVYSGTITENGVTNLHHGFVMVEKGPDPEGKLMDEGVFRLFKDSDGLSNRVDWDQAPSVRSRSAIKENQYSSMRSSKLKNR